MIERILRIIKLDFSVFREIESDPAATGQAAIIVAVTTFFSAIGSAVASQNAVMSFLGSMISGLVGWVVWSVVTFYIGRSLFRGRGTLDNMLRVLGYASAPNILGFFSFIPCLGWLAALAGFFLSLIAGIMAIKEGLDLDTGGAIGVAVVGWIAMMIVSMIFGLIFGGAFALATGLGRAITGR
ncbi:MAG: hypothetical protein FJ026_01440 [Chloroflexi bacterium]|nr:hypothetical protein [Chloroflexota bacterium]